MCFLYNTILSSHLKLHLYHLWLILQRLLIQVLAEHAKLSLNLNGDLAKLGITFVKWANMAMFSFGCMLK